MVKMGTVSVPQGCCNKVPQTGWCKKQPLLVSELRRPHVWSQVAGRAGPLWGQAGGVCPVPRASGALLAVLGISWLLYSSPQSLPLSPHDIIAVCKSVSRCSFSIGHSRPWLGPTSNSSFKWITFATTLFPNKVTFRSAGFDFIWIFEAHNSIHNSDIYVVWFLPQLKIKPKPKNNPPGTYNFSSKRPKAWIWPGPGLPLSPAFLLFSLRALASWLVSWVSHVSLASGSVPPTYFYPFFSPSPPLRFVGSLSPFRSQLQSYLHGKCLYDSPAWDRLFYYIHYLWFGYLLPCNKALQNFLVLHSIHSITPWILCARGSDTAKMARVSSVMSRASVGKIWTAGG